MSDARKMASQLKIRSLGLAFLFSQTALGATGIWCAWPVGWAIAAIASIGFYHAENRDDTKSRKCHAAGHNNSQG